MAAVALNSYVMGGRRETASAASPRQIWYVRAPMDEGSADHRRSTLAAPEFAEPQMGALRIASRRLLDPFDLIV